MDRLIKNRAARRYIYGVATAALAVLGVYGVLTGEQMAVIAGLAAAVTGLAGINVPSRDTGEGPQHAEQV